MGGDEVIVYSADASGSFADLSNCVVTGRATDLSNCVVDVSGSAAAAATDREINISINLDANITPIQRAAITAVIAEVSAAVSSMLSGQITAVNITLLLGKLVKTVENIVVEGGKLHGADKKVVVLEVGRQLIKRFVHGGQQENAIFIYEMAAEPVVDTLVDVSRNVNVAGAIAAAVAAPGDATAAGPAVASILCGCINALMKK
jgi:hypothetical protein